jgi:hypothetical protein
MEIFEVRLSAASEDKLSELTRCLNESFADLHMDGRLETVPALGLIVYRRAGGPPDEKERLAIHSRAAEGMAEYVISAVEPELVRIMIRKYYPCSDDDMERIAELCMKMLGALPDRPDGSAKTVGPLAQDTASRDRTTREPSRKKSTRELPPQNTAFAAINRTARPSCVPASARGGRSPAGQEGADEADGAGRDGWPSEADGAGRDGWPSGAAATPGADGFAPSPDSSGAEPGMRRGQRKRHIAAELLAYLQERPSLHLEGYITFRLDKYWEELAEAAEAAVDEFVMDRQYREFIGLLNEFVGLQQPKVSSVNLVLKADGGFALYDETFRPMDPADGGRVTADFTDEELNVEDMVVSCLIAVSPREITLHARDPELPVVRTIEAIFTGRVTVCAGCRSCRPLTGAVLN